MSSSSVEKVAEVAKSASDKATKNAERRRRAERNMLIFCGLTVLGLGTWYLGWGNEIETSADLAARAFTPAEMAKHSSEVIAAANSGGHDFARGVSRLAWPPAPTDAQALEDAFHVRLDMIDRTLGAFEVPQDHEAAELFVRLRAMVHCLRKNHRVVEAIDAAVAAHAPADYQTWLQQFDAVCDGARAKLQTAWKAYVK